MRQRQGCTGRPRPLDFPELRSRQNPSPQESPAPRPCPDVPVGPARDAGRHAARAPRRAAVREPRRQPGACVTPGSGRAAAQTTCPRLAHGTGSDRASNLSAAGRARAVARPATSTPTAARWPTCPRSPPRRRTGHDAQREPRGPGSHGGPGARVETGCPWLASGTGPRAARRDCVREPRRQSVAASRARGGSGYGRSAPRRPRAHGSRRRRPDRAASRERASSQRRRAGRGQRATQAPRPRLTQRAGQRRARAHGSRAAGPGRPVGRPGGGAQAAGGRTRQRAGWA